MLTLRRAVLAHATPRPQQRQAAREAGNALLSPGRPLLQRGVSQGCFQGAPTFFNRRPEGGKNVAPICLTINRRPRQKFCRCFNALRVQENRSRILPDWPARLPDQRFRRLPLPAGKTSARRGSMKQRHGGSNGESLRATTGHAAKLTVANDDGNMKRHRKQPESQSARFLFVHDGRACCGHVISRGPKGWEAFNQHDESVGTFASAREAAAALPGD